MLAAGSGFRGVDSPLDHVGAEIDEVGVGRIVAGEQSLLSQPEAVVAAEQGLQLLAVLGEDAGRNTEVRVNLRGEGIEIAGGGNRRSHTMAAENDDLLELGIVDSLGGENGAAAESQRDGGDGAVLHLLPLALERAW